MAIYRKINKTRYSFHNVYADYNAEIDKWGWRTANPTEHERGLDEACEEGGQHEWLVLPYEKGQKQYLMCLKCRQHSHL